jgi:hypothetical protein
VRFSSFCVLAQAIPGAPGQLVGRSVAGFGEQLHGVRLAAASLDVDEVVLFQPGDRFVDPSGAVGVGACPDQAAMPAQELGRRVRAVQRRRATGSSVRASIGPRHHGRLGLADGVISSVRFVPERGVPGLISPVAAVGGTRLVPVPIRRDDKSFSSRRSGGTSWCRSVSRTKLSGQASTSVRHRGSKRQFGLFVEVTARTCPYGHVDSRFR